MTMGIDRTDDLALRFEEQRPQLRAVALRILGADADADDVVQEAWLRLSRADTREIDNLGGWLTTVTARLCLDRLRAGATRTRGEEAAEEMSSGSSADPEHEALVADSVGSALAVVLDTLSPSERVAFVLHDVFDVPFVDVGVVLGRSPNAAKQLASRARSRLRGDAVPGDPPRAQVHVVDAFLAAARAGDLAGLVAVLDPDVVLRADAAAVRMGGPDEVLGADAVAAVFSGRALEALPAVVDGVAAIVWAPEGHAKVVWEIDFADGVISRMDMLAAEETLADLDLAFSRP
jgi:RNA polymerase sigma factor (sigma-70 family)